MTKTEQTTLLFRLSQLTKHNREFRQDSQESLKERRRLAEKVMGNLGSNIETTQQPEPNKDVMRLS
ncbi:MAG TPA: hypothetical protein VGF14_02140 [Alphaproteobacteria bacterium]